MLWLPFITEVCIYTYVANTFPLGFSAFPEGDKARLPAIVFCTYF